MKYSSAVGVVTRSRGRVRTRLAVGAIVAFTLARLSAQTVLPGQNVNMVSGTEYLTGDPYLQRQNEPSIAASTRNVLHLLGGANDYRTVDLPFYLLDKDQEKPTGDSWLGVFKSLDGGQTWTSTLIPGFPQDTSAVGTKSVLRAYDAAADPLVRAGSNGLFFYSGIAFSRGANTGSAALQAGLDESAHATATRGRASHTAAARERERERKREQERGRGRDRKNAAAAEHQRQLKGGLDDDDGETGTGDAGSAIFVSTFIDLNNREGSNPIAFLRTTLVDRDSGVRFLDKQWSAVDVPRAGAPQCSFNVIDQNNHSHLQSFPGGRVYVAYTAFTGKDDAQRGQMLVSSSADCGVTWSRPHDISSTPNPDVNGDGVVTIADVNAAKASYGKVCGDPGFNPAADTNGNCAVDILDQALISRSVGKIVPTAHRVPQGASIAIDPLTGAVNIAWREFKHTSAQPDAIMFARSTNFGATFSAPVQVATFLPYDQGTTDTSFRASAFPTIAADGTRLYLAWSARGFAAPDVPVANDARIVMATSSDGKTWTAPRAVDEPHHPGHQIMPALTFGAGKLSLLYYDLRDDVSQLFQQYVDEKDILAGAPQLLRHTVDVRVAQAAPAVAPTFTSVQLSNYAVGVTDGGTAPTQLQFNPPNLPLFKHGSVPFMGDYLDVVYAPTMVVDASGRWSFNVAPSSTATGHAVWTDNRDVRVAAGGNLVNYTPPNSPARGTMSVFDPTQALPNCDPAITGTRNQNIYTARFDQGLLAAALGNAKPLDPALERAFALLVTNATNANPAATDGSRSFRLTIPTQPPGGHASFQQMAAGGQLQTTLDLSIPPQSTAARTVYVTSSVANARIDINVDEISAPNGSPVFAGLHGTIVLNGDPTTPPIEGAGIDTAETYTPQISTGVSAPRIDNPRIDNPRIDNPRIDNPRIDNRGVVSTGVEAPRIDNSAVETPRIDNPRIDNTSLANASISDTTWELTNSGNTAAVYDVKLLLAPNRQVPNGVVTQLVIHKTYTSPTADGCNLTVQQNNVLVTNITTPAFITDPNAPRIDNPRIDNATVALAPGETANITLRVFDLNKNDNITFDPLNTVAPATAPQAVNTDAAAAGVTQPPVVIGLSISPAVVPDAVLGQPYQQPLQATFSLSGNWSVVAGTLPPGLQLNGNTGVITGTATTPGTYQFSVRFTDGAVPPHTTTQAYVVHVSQALAIATTTLPDAIANVSNNIPINAIGGFGGRTWSVTGGSLPPGLALGPSTGVISGSPTATGRFTFTVNVKDSATPPADVSQTFTVNVSSAFFNRAWVGVDSNWSNPLNWNPTGVPDASSSVIIPGGLAHPPVLSADSFVSSLQLAAGASLDTNGHLLTVSGSLDAGHTITGTGTVVMTGGEVNLKGTVSNLIIAGPGVFLNGPLTVTGDLTVTGSLSLQGYPIVVAGRLLSGSTPGSLSGGAGTFSATELSGEWSGTILTSGLGPATRFPLTATLTQNGTTWTATSPHLAGVLFHGTFVGTTSSGEQQFDVTVTATNPGSCSPATFTGTILINPATGVLTGSTSGRNTDCLDETDTLTLQKGSTLAMGGVNVDGLTFDNVLLTIDRGAIERFDNVVFRGFPSTVLQLRINHPGAATPFTFNNPTFQNTPGTGFYIFATDTAADENPLRINLQNPAASNGPGHTLVANGAVVNWINASTDLAASQTDAPDPAYVNGALTYHVTVSNAGPNTASAVQLTDTLPNGASLQSAVLSQGSCAPNAGSIVTCSLGDLAAGASVTVDVTVIPSVAGTVSNRVELSSSTPDPNPANNTSTESTAVLPASADVSVAKSHAPAQPVVGQNLTYTLTATNNGPSTATNVLLTDTLPAGLTFVSVGDSDRCLRSGSTITCRVTALAAGASVSFPIVVQPTVAQPITNTATVSADQSDPVQANNTASDPAMVLAFGPCANPTFSGPYPTDVGPGGATTLATADFDGDGKRDVVVAQGNSNQVALLRGNGDGTFQAPTYFTVGNSPTSVVNGDFNHDGHPDVAVSNSQSHSVSVLLNNGNSGFAPAVSYTVAGTSFSMVAMDLDADGNLDLAIGDASTSTTNVTVLYGNSDGTFAPAVLYPSGPSPTNIVVGDLDGDGKIDIAVPNTGTHTISILKNAGSRTFAAPVQITLTQIVVRLRQLGDVNGDGKPDLGVTTNNGSGPSNLMLLLNSGGATFAPPVEILPPSYSVGYTAPGDFNGDGKADLAAISAANGGIASLLIMFGNGDGTFAAPVGYLVGPQNFHEIADIDGDGRPDVIGVGPSSNDVWVLLNRCGAVGVADLTVTKTGPTTANAGDTLTYTVSVTNHGPNTATGVVITDAPMAGGIALTGASAASAACSTTTQRATCILPTLASGATATMTVTGTTTAAGTRVNRAAATSRETDPNPADNSATATTTINAGSVTFTVTNTLDAGTGSLRQAISDSNGNPGATNRIEFDIPGTGPFTISMFSGFGVIFVPVVIDATTQRGFAGTPIIELSGAGAASGFSGLNITAGGSAVRGLAINGMAGNGIFFSTNGGNVAEGNYIGTDITGTIAKPNGTGISISSSNNIVGPNNVISGNSSQGVFISGAGATQNVVKGNRIGTNASGTAILGNGGEGVTLFSGASNNTVGGTGSGEGNQISGNQFGMSIGGTGTDGNRVQGNFIGTNPGGTAALGNLTHGININTNAANNTVGGTTAAAANVISGNVNGILILSGANNNSIQGNFVGTNSGGTIAIPNSSNGINLDAAINNTLGGTAPGSGNVISGNGGNGVSINNGSTANLIQGNKIGTNAEGAAAIANNLGIQISDSSNNVIGGATGAARNVISGNRTRGVGISQFIGTATGNQVLGNYIGTNAGGTLAIGNGFSSGGPFYAGVGIDTSNNIVANNVISGGFGLGVNMPTSTGSGNVLIGNLIGTDVTGTVALPNAGGVGVTGPGNRIGGTSSADRNLISGNGGTGINVSTSTAIGNQILGNYIGTNAAGTAALTNSGSGIFISAGASSNQIGGSAAGSRNVLSGNTFSGVDIRGNNNIVQGNLIGTNVSGAAAIGNNDGVFLADSATGNVIGGTTQDSRNVISGNRFTGVTIRSLTSGVAGATQTTVQGNLIGTTAAGNAPLPNASAGVFIQDAASNTIGGTTLGARNVISGNTGTAVLIQGTAATNNRVSGNFIGTDINGTAAVPNQSIQSGVFLNAGASNNTIGGSVAGAGNVVSGNANHAITVVGLNTANNVIQGNLVGTDVTGTTRLANVGIGVDVVTASSTVIGGVGLARNVISGNGTAIQIRTGSTGTVVQGNFIGTDVTGTATIANSTAVHIVDASGNTIGGTTPGTGNRIVGNGGTGVGIGGSTSSGNPIRGNSISANAFLGIDLNDDGVTANDVGDGDSGPNNRQNFPVITQSTITNSTSIAITASLNSAPNSTFSVDFFANASCDASGNGEGDTFLGSGSISTNGSGGGTTSVTFPYVAGSGAVITSTATDAADNTSEFSNCVVVTNAAGPRTLTVSNTNDAGGGSLRQAILDANSNSGFTDTIAFNISGPGTHTIAVNSSLPVITDAVIIDGTTQPGYNGKPVIELDGANAGETADGLFITAGNSTVRGMAINRFGFGGLAFQVPRAS